MPHPAEEIRHLNRSLRDSHASGISPTTAFSVDIESKAASTASDEAHLLNTSISSFSWSDVTVTVKDYKTKTPKNILNNVSGFVEAGEICALMGPSGCGKTTLLDVLAHRDLSSGANIEGITLVNGIKPSLGAFRELSSYVEQDDALIGSLTVKETLHFAARLAHKNSLTKSERTRRIESLINSFGLTSQAHTIVGTPIRRGLSGGQKRRVSVASQLVTGPKILFLDEPTSGLDSAASWEVISFVKEVAKRNNLIVIASIHQPSTSVFHLFDKLLLLSGGSSPYFGPISDASTYFQSIGCPIPLQTNPAEFMLELLNTDFAKDHTQAEINIQRLETYWATSAERNFISARIDEVQRSPAGLPPSKSSAQNFPITVMALVHRSFIKSYRDVIAYGVRIVMYTSLAIMMGTIWLRLSDHQDAIIPFTNAIFFGSAFMSFMAVAYIPSYLEDRATFIKERANGLYGATAFMVSNFIIGLPYLFLISFIFSVIAYWLSGFRSNGSAFITFVMWLFLDLVAAESLVVFISSIFPVFVISLALTAFANGLWMSVAGFLVTPKILNVFWRYVFHYIDYQTYVFQGMMVNEFVDRTYICGDDCQCMYQTELAAQCKIAGTGVLDKYGYKAGHTGEWVGIILGIVLGYRLLAWGVIAFRK